MSALIFASSMLLPSLIILGIPFFHLSLIILVFITLLINFRKILITKKDISIFLFMVVILSFAFNRDITFILDSILYLGKNFLLPYFFIVVIRGTLREELFKKYSYYFLITWIVISVLILSYSFDGFYMQNTMRLRYLVDESFFNLIQLTPLESRNGISRVLIILYIIYAYKIFPRFNPYMFSAVVAMVLIYETRTYSIIMLVISLYHFSLLIKDNRSGKLVSIAVIFLGLIYLSQSGDFTSRIKDWKESERIEQFHFVEDETKNNMLFGKGFGLNRTGVLYNFNGGSNNIHSSYFGSYYEVGLVGLITYILFIIRLFHLSSLRKTKCISNEILLKNNSLRFLSSSFLILFMLSGVTYSSWFGVDFWFCVLVFSVFNYQYERKRNLQH